MTFVRRSFYFAISYFKDKLYPEHLVSPPTPEHIMNKQKQLHSEHSCPSGCFMEELEEEDQMILVINPREMLICKFVTNRLSTFPIDSAGTCCNSYKDG